MIVIIYGPQGDGKTRRAKEFLAHFGCARLVEEWDGRDTLLSGDLAITNLEPPFKIKGARAIPAHVAKAAVASPIPTRRGN